MAYLRPKNFIPGLFRILLRPPCFLKSYDWDHLPHGFDLFPCLRLSTLASTIFSLCLMASVTDFLCALTSCSAHGTNAVVYPFPLSSKSLGFVYPYTNFLESSYFFRYLLSRVRPFFLRRSSKQLIFRFLLTVSFCIITHHQNFCLTFWLVAGDPSRFLRGTYGGFFSPPYRTVDSTLALWLLQTRPTFPSGILATQYRTVYVHQSKRNVFINNKYKYKHMMGLAIDF